MRVLTMLSLLVALSSALSAQSIGNAATRSAQEEDIREAVIRYQIGQSSRKDPKYVDPDYAKQKGAVHSSLTVCFISINGRDPSDEFLKRFRDVPMAVKKFSRAKEHFVIFDRKTHEEGIILDISGIRWQSDSLVQVDSKLRTCSSCSWGRTYTVRFENGKWVVASSKLTWMS